jgi:hypothetical protein
VGFFYFFIPSVISVMKFIPVWTKAGSSTTHFVAWCVFSYHDYRFWLNWAPKLFVMATIVVIYFSIYMYVKMEVRALGKLFRSTRLEAHVSSPHGRDLMSSKSPRTWMLSVKKWLSQFPGLNFLYPYGLSEIYNARNGHISQTNMVSLTENNPELRNVTELQESINSENLIRFQRRRTNTEYQVRFLFVYPAVYIFLWAFPLITQFVNQGGYRGLVPSYITIFILGISGAINAFVFYGRESRSQLLDPLVERPSESQLVPTDRIELNRAVTAQTSREKKKKKDYSAKGPSTASSFEATADAWSEAESSPRSGQQLASQLRNFRFRTMDEVKQVEMSTQSEVKRSEGMSHTFEESSLHADKARYSHAAADAEGIEEMDLTEFLRQ